MLYYYCYIITILLNSRIQYKNIFHVTGHKSLLPHCKKSLLSVCSLSACVRLSGFQTISDVTNQAPDPPLYISIEFT